MELNLLEKKELWIENIKLNNINLNEVAKVVAKTLNLEIKKVMVVDVRENFITLDILRNTLQIEDIIGKEKILLKNLAKVKGLTISNNTCIHSDGVLGLIAVEPEEKAQFLSRVNSISRNIKNNFLRRAKIFASGIEVQKKLIKDTNTPMIIDILKARGFKVERGDILPDNKVKISQEIFSAINEGYGLIITTGGVGAESKDQTIEGILQLDPEAETPYITYYHKGTGRHIKDGVRIGVGKVGEAIILSLPGPNDEARVGIEAFIEDFFEGCDDKSKLANKVARALIFSIKEKNKKK